MQLGREMSISHVGDRIMALLVANGEQASDALSYVTLAMQGARRVG
jgi:hypothetical protein